MICDLCHKEILHGEDVMMQQYGTILNGKFEPSEELTVQHDECEDDD